MKNKKNKKQAFTLVELLAVIVLLAIILVIAVPKITDTKKQSKKSSLESSTKLVASTLETDYQSSLVASTTFAESGSCASYVDSNEYSVVIKQLNSSNAEYWLRSPKSITTETFFVASNYGNWLSSYAHYSGGGISPAFRIA